MTYIKPHRLIAAIALCFVGLATAQDAPQRLPTTRLTAGFPFDAWIHGLRLTMMLCEVVPVAPSSSVTVRVTV